MHTPPAAGLRALALATLFTSLLLSPALADQTVPDGTPVLGYSAAEEVLVLVHTRKPSKVQVRYKPQDVRRARWQSSPTVLSAAEDHLVARVRLTDLKPATRYTYEVRVNGRRIRNRSPLRFQTQAAWHRRHAPPDFTVALGSCAYVNDPVYDDGPKIYGGGYEIYGQILSHNPDLMLWLGDNVYFRPGDQVSGEAMARRYRRSRSLEAIQPLLASVHNYATWDDHDFGPNDADRSFPLKHKALEVFSAHWGNPSYGLPDLPGVFGQFTWSDVDFFVIDDRYHRAPVNAPDGPDKPMLGDAQLSWLIDALTASKAPFKVVVSGSQVLNRYGFFETYARFADERARLLDAIKSRRIEGVVFLSGDRHHGELIKVQPEGMYPLYDFTTSPLTAGRATADKERDHPDRMPGTLIIERRNFGLLQISGPEDDRQMVMEARGIDGKVLWRHAIKASELTFR